MKNYSVQLKYYERRDPVTGQTQGLYRNAHSRQSSPVVLEHHRCVRASMEGVRARSADPRENAQAIRSALAQASRSCGGRGRSAAAARRERSAA